MGLASALSTALTGLGAAEATIDVVGNNVANSNTVGFKASSASFATQFLQTRSLGSAPTENRGGTNPRQVGLGVTVAEITPDFTQGTIQVSSNPSDLAIQGDGFFMIEGTGGERLYTRNGIFKTNSENELVTISGQRLLGHTVDDEFVIQPTTLQPLTIPLGAKSVAQATQNAYMVGTLSPTGDVADTAEIIQSGFLSDGSIEVPTNMTAADIDASAQPTVQNSGTAGLSITPASDAGLTGVGATGGTLPVGNYFYKIVHVNAAGLEGVPSATINATVGAGEDAVQLSTLPVVPPGFSGTRVYRSTTGAAGSFQQVGGTLPSGMTTFTDLGTAGGATLIEGTGLPAPPTGPAVYNYKIVFVDADGNEGPPSTIPGEIDATTNNRRAQLTGLPSASGDYTTKRIYRSTTVTAGEPSGPYELVGADIPPLQATFTDNGVAPGGAVLNEDALAAGNYGYYVTFRNSTTGVESRPTALIGPQSLPVDGSRIRLQNLPQPDPLGTLGWDSVVIYRNLSNDTESFYRVDTLALGTTTYLDDNPDSAISGNDPVNLEGPGINLTTTRLVDVVQRDGNTYRNVFAEGALTFAGLKGGQRQGEKELVVTANTTVEEFLVFAQQSMGIITQSGDPNNPLPQSDNALTDTVGDTIGAGGRVVYDLLGRSKLQIVGNNGERNAIEIDLSAMKQTVGDETQAVNLNFSSAQEAVGESAAADFIAYDSLGIPLNIRVTTVLESRDSSTTTYRWYADSPQNDPREGAQTNVGTGLIRFDGEGNLVSVTNDTVAVQRENVSATSPLEFNLDFSQVSGLATDNSSLNADRQDGFGTGTLSSFIIGEEGRIRGVFTNGTTRDLGQVRLARFANPSGLQAKGENAFAAGVNSGLPIEGDPGQQGIGTIVAGATEQSNTDIGKNLIDLILASTQYRGNTRVITAAQQLLDELMNLRR